MGICIIQILLVSVKLVKCIMCVKMGRIAENLRITKSTIGGIIKRHLMHRKTQKIKCCADRLIRVKRTLENTNLEKFKDNSLQRALKLYPQLRGCVAVKTAAKQLTWTTKIAQNLNFLDSNAKFSSNAPLYVYNPDLTRPSQSPDLNHIGLLQDELRDQYVVSVCGSDAQNLGIRSKNIYLAINY